MMKVLIAGGAGFIGSHLCKKLLDNGDTVVVLDNLCTGRIENVKRFRDNHNYQFINRNVATDSLDDLKSEKFDRVYNLASPANPPYCFSHSLETLQTNVFGTFNLAEVAKDCNARFFVASSSEVYGNPEISPQKEDYHGNVNPVGIRACYDEAKRCAETIAYDYNRYFNLDVRVARIFNTYGPDVNINDGRVFVRFLCNAIKGEPLVIYGSGSQTRSFCYVDDLVNGIMLLMEHEWMPSGPVNLGNTEEYTIKEVAMIIKEITASSSDIVYVSGTEDDPQKRRPDITLANQLLGWQPHIEFRQGLLLSFPYFMEQINNN